MPTRLFSDVPISINELTADKYYLFIGHDMSNRPFEKFLQYVSHTEKRILSNEIVTISYRENPTSTRTRSISFNKPLTIYPLNIEINRTYTFHFASPPANHYLYGIDRIPWFVGHVSHITENGVAHFVSKAHRYTTNDVFAYNVIDILPEYLPNEKHTVPMLIALDGKRQEQNAMMEALAPELFDAPRGGKKSNKNRRRKRKQKLFTIKNKKFIL